MMQETVDGFVRITKNAAERVLELGAQDPSFDAQNPPCLRVTVVSGGCSGFQYIFSLDRHRQEEDHFFTEHGVTLLIDDVSFPFLQGAEVDYVEELIGSSFVIRNPNASSSCGCGSSFNV